MNGLQAASKYAWFFVGGVLTSTTEEQLTNYVKKKIPNADLRASKIETSGTNTCFKLGCPYVHRELLEDPQFWPKFCRSTKAYFSTKSVRAQNIITRT